MDLTGRNPSYFVDTVKMVGGLTIARGRSMQTNNELAGKAETTTMRTVFESFFDPTSGGWSLRRVACATLPKEEPKSPRA